MKLVTRGGPKIKGKFTTTQCLSDGCTDVYWANNLCRKHYLKHYFANQPGNDIDRGRKHFRRNSIAYEVSLITGIPFLKARKIVRIIFDTITKALEEGKEVYISGFGYFGIHKRSKHVYGYPAYFWPSRELKTLINKYYEGEQ